MYQYHQLLHYIQTISSIQGVGELVLKVCLREIGAGFCLGWSLKIWSYADFGQGD
jgi:hypothetical protein